MYNKKKVTYDSLLTTEIISGKSSSANISLSFAFVVVVVA
jgi:hypothetical protein